jgi:2-oxoglutarate ferredoxin oxidoreductase subunit delta
MLYERTPLDADKVEIPKGEVHVIEERCRGCGFCVKYCPKDVLEISQEVNRMGFRFPVATREDQCVNCGFCEIICPELAVWSTAKDAQRPVISTGDR